MAVLAHNKLVREIAMVYGLQINRSIDQACIWNMFIPTISSQRDKPIQYTQAVTGLASANVLRKISLIHA
jgi:hypothetical protein